MDARACYTRSTGQRQLTEHKLQQSWHAQLARQRTARHRPTHRLLALHQGISLHLPPMTVHHHRQAAARLRLQLVVLHSVAEKAVR